jgi:hypothetical protein
MCPWCVTDDFERVTADVKTLFVTCGRDPSAPRLFLRLISTCRASVQPQQGGAPRSC